MKAGKTGTRVGDWFLWIDVETIKTADYRNVPLVTLRRAITGGDVLSTVVGTKAMARELRQVADAIEAAVAAVEAASEVAAAE